MSINLFDESVRINKELERIGEQWKQELLQAEHEIMELNEILASSEAKTDRRENAVFQIAKDERDIKVGKQRTLQNKYDAYLEYNFKSEYTPNGVAKLGSTLMVTLLSIGGIPYSGDKSTLIFKLVPHDLSQATVGLFSVDSPLGNGVLGHTGGDVVTVTAPAGKVQYRIERIY